VVGYKYLLRNGKYMTSLTTRFEVVFDEDFIIKSMLETGEYGIGGYPISEEAMIELVKNISFGLDHEANFEDEYPGQSKSLSITNDNGDCYFYWAKDQQVN